MSIPQIQIETPDLPTDSELLDRLAMTYWQGGKPDEHGNPPWEVVRAGIVERLITDRDRIEQNEEMLTNISQVINTPGRHPQHHFTILQRHTREWPILWRILDRVRHTR